jgi:ABC-type nitrate/sulfonate/bicarbonate transport system permease component
MTTTAFRPATRANRAVGPDGPQIGSRPPLRGLLPFVALLVLWQLFGTDDSTFFPRPSTWLPAVVEFAESGELATALAGTAVTFTVGLLLATAIGVVLGVVVGSVRFVDRMLNPFLEFVRAMPSSAQVPIFVLILGFTESMKLTVVVLTAMFPVLLSTRSGMREMNPVLLDVARTLHLSRYDRIRKIVVPSLFSSILTGVRIATPVVLIVTLIVEILTQVPGLGGSLSLAQQYYQTSLAYGLIVITTVVALGVNIAIGLIDERLVRHRRR